MKDCWIVMCHVSSSPICNERFLKIVDTHYETVFDI